MMQSRNKKLAFCGLFSAFAIVLGYVESFIFIPGLLPGMKIGLANIVTVIVLLLYGIKYAASVSLVRIVVVNSLFGNITWAMFSLAGAMLSLIFMYFAKRTGRFSPMGISVLGSVAHNLGQTIVAMIIFENVGMFYYFPFLLIFGTVAGAFVGLASALIYRRMAKVKREQNM